MTKKIYELTKEEIDEFIQKLLPVKKIEKDKYGEVFTNPQLINKLLDLFPNSVWSNPELRWLDPAVGAGFFMIFIYQRLMKGLKKWEPNELTRSNHIISNMLFMIEINETNCNLCKELFGKKIQILCSDFLGDWHFFKKDKILFDIIIGNPPFQDDYGHNSKGKRIQGGKNKLYERFFLKSYDILKKDGFISFIVPDNIFSGNGSESYRIIIKNRVPFVSFNPSNQAFFPGIQQYICYFLLQKKNNNSELTLIESNYTNKLELILSDRPVNPIRNWTNHTEKLINKYISNERNNVKYIRGLNLSSYRGNKYQVVFSPIKMLYSNNEKMALNSGYKQKKVIIFSMALDLSFKMDYSGNLVAGSNTFFIPFTTIEQGKRLERFLKSEEYKLMALATKTTRQYLKIAFLEHLTLTNIMGKNKFSKNILKTKQTLKKQINKTMKNKNTNKNKTSKNR